MFRTLRSALLLSCLLLVASPALATELEPGQTYAAGTSLTISAFGIAFTVPDGFSGQVPHGEEYFLMGHATADGQLLLVAEELTAADARTYMSQPIPLDEGMTLTPVGELEVEGSRLTRDFQLRFHGMVMNARGFVEVGDHGLSVIGLALFDAGEAELMGRALQSVAESISLTEPAQPAAQAQPEPTERPATAQTGTGGGDLAGRAVVRYHNSEITSSTWRYFFCSDGTFAYRYNSSTVSTGGMGSLSMADQDSAQGRWTMSGNTVTLTTDQGAELTLEISDRSGSSLTVSGQTWHFTENTFCS